LATPCHSANILVVLGTTLSLLKKHTTPSPPHLISTHEDPLTLTPNPKTWSLRNNTSDLSTFTAYLAGGSLFTVLPRLIHLVNSIETCVPVILIQTHTMSQNKKTKEEKK